MTDMIWTSVVVVVVISGIFWFVVPSPNAAFEHHKNIERYKARLQATKMAEKCFLRLVEQGIPEEKAAKMAVAYANAFAEEMNK